MKGQIVLSIFLINLLFVFTISETPEERCTKEGQSVCVNCQQVGTCHGSAPPYTVENFTECEYNDGLFCYGNLEVEPDCFRVNPAAIGCGCSESSCIVDPNTENVYIPCDGEGMRKAFYCPPAKIEMETCVCSATGRPTLSTLESSTSESSSTSELSTTPEVSSTSEISTTTELSSTSEIPTTTTGLSSTSEISTTELSSTSEISTTTRLSSTSEISTTTELSSTSEIPTTTTELSSTSEIPTTTTELSSTSEIPTTTTGLSSTSEISTTELSSSSEISTTTELSTTTTTKLTCPDECPFVQDPNEVDCRKYFQCTDEGNVPSQCPSSLCFSQELCACTAPLECTDDCQFVDDPIDDCKKYYYCYNDQLIEYNCTGSSCFSQSSCGCVEEKSSTMSTSTSTTPTTSTTSTTTKPTCPPGCPFVDDPSDDCKKFFICDNGELVPHECPGTLCYREALCQCDV